MSAARRLITGRKNPHVLEQYSPGTLPYYAALKALTPEELSQEWQEITLEQYWYLMECVPPIHVKSRAFMVGECLTHTDRGAIYEAVCQVDERYFARPALLQSFKPNTYAEEIRRKFQL